MYTDTVTVFNLKDDIWYPSILSDVDLIVDKGANVVKTGLDSADTAKLHVKYALSDSGTLIGDKTYLTPKEWQAQDDSNATTFTEGADFFILGDWGSEDGISDDQYGVNGFYHYCNKKYDHCYLITTVGKYKVIPHFEMGGK